MKQSLRLILNIFLVFCVLMFLMFCNPVKEVQGSIDTSGDETTADVDTVEGEVDLENLDAEEVIEDLLEGQLFQRFWTFIILLVAIVDISIVAVFLYSYVGFGIGGEDGKESPKLLAKIKTIFFYALIVTAIVVGIPLFIRGLWQLVDVDWS